MPAPAINVDVLADLGLCGRCGRPHRSVRDKTACPRCQLSVALDLADFWDASAGAPTLSATLVPAPAGLAGKGQRLGDYEILGEIARGGMGIVYRARQIALNREVALKTLLGGQHSGPGFLRRFKTEAESAAKLRHPNIVVVYESGEYLGMPYLAMEYVPGQNLAALTQQGPLPARRAVAYLQQIAGATHYAHKMGVLHRDLKPANILLDEDGRPRITDFGLARCSDTESELTVTGQVLGSPSYMPPEQASFNHARIGPWSDVYSLGAILYQLVTGRAPFLAGSLSEVLQLIQHREPVAPRLLNPHVPLDVETITLKCLEKDPAKRYASAAALAEECARILRDEPIQARPTGRVIKFCHWCRRNPPLASMGAAVFLLLLTVTIGSVVSAWRIAKANEALEVENFKRRHSLYVADMNVAAGAYASGNLRQAVRLLERHKPSTNEIDLRGFVWRYLWQLCRGSEAEIYPLEELRSPHELERCAVQFLSGSRVLVATGDGSSLRLSELQDQRVVTRVLASPGSDLTVFDVAPGGHQLIAADRQGQLLTWDLTKRSLGAPSIMPAPDKLSLLAYSRDGRSLLGLTENGQATWWRTGNDKEATLLEEARLPESIGFEDLCAVSSDLVQLVFLDRRTHGLVLWTPTTQAELVPSPGQSSSIECAAFSSDGRYLAAGSADGTIRLWDLPSRATLTVLMGHRNLIQGMAFSHDNRTLASWSLDNSVKLWDVASQEAFATLKGHTEPVIRLAFSPDDRAVTSLGADRTARIWQTDRDDPETEISEHTTGVYGCAFSPDERWLAAFGVDGTLLLWDLAERVVLELIRADPDAAGYQLRFTPDGTRLLTQGVVSGAIDVWDLGSRRWVGEIAIPGSCFNDWDLLPHTNQVMAAADNGRLYLFDLDGFGLLWSTDAYGGPVNSVAIASNGGGFATVGMVDSSIRSRSQLRLWTLPTMEPIAQTKLSQSPASRVRYLPGQELLLTTHVGTADFCVRFWSVPSLRQLGEIRPDYYYALTVSPDGRNLAFGCTDQSIRIWSIARIGEELMAQVAFQLVGHRSVIGGLSFSAGGDKLASCSEDRSIRLWRAPSLQEIDAIPHLRIP